MANGRSVASGVATVTTGSGATAGDRVTSGVAAVTTGSGVITGEAFAGVTGSDACVELPESAALMMNGVPTARELFCLFFSVTLV